MVMKAMRSGTKPVLWIVVFAFVGTIVFAWGMDFTRPEVAAGVVGEVNGSDLMLENYSFLYQNTVAQRQQEGAGVSDEEARQIRDQVFERMVQNRILTQIIEDLGLLVTGRELVEHLRRFPPPEVQQTDIFLTNGQFDYNKYLQRLQNPSPGEWLGIEALMRDRILQQKLYEYVTASTLVDDVEVKELYDAASEKVRVRYVLAATNAYLDTVGFPDSAYVLDYYESNLEDYRHTERAKLTSVSFDKKPSADDSAVVLREAEDIVARARAGESFTDLALTYTEDEATPNGDLGWFGKGAMVKAFQETAFALDSGQVSDPVGTPFGYHVIKVEGRRGIGDSTQIKASHILLKLEASPSTLSDLRLRAEQFADDARRGDMDSLSTAYALGLRSSAYFERGQSRIGFLGNPIVVEFTFNNPAGTVCNPIETESGFVVAKILARDPEGIAPLEEVRGRVQATIRNRNAGDYAYETLLPMGEAIAAGMSFREAAEQAGRRVDSIAPFGRLDLVPGYGRDAVMRGLAFSLSDDNPVSPVARTNRGAMIMELIARDAPDPQEYAEKRDSVMTVTFGGKRQIVFNQWFAQVRQAADVKDFRYQLPGGGL